MGVWGADVAGLEAVAMDLERYAETIEQARATIDAQLNRTAWQGPSADQFRQRWRAIAIRDLDGFRTDCRQTAADLRRQAQDQRTASDAGRGQGAGSGRGRGSGAAVVSQAMHGPTAVPFWFEREQQYGPVVAGWMREGFASSPNHAAETAAGLSLTAIATGHTAVRLYSTAPGVLRGSTGAFLHYSSRATPPPAFLSAAARPGLVHAAGHTLSFGAAALAGGFSQWNADVDHGLMGVERATRSAAVGATHGAIVTGVGAAATKGFAAAALVTFPPAAVAAPLVGMAASAGTSALLHTEVGRSFSTGVAEAGSALYDVGSDVADLGASAVEAAGSVVRDASKVLDDVGGAVTGVLSGAASRFNPFGG